jgi:hypothetical protein
VYRDPSVTYFYGFVNMENLAKALEQTILFLRQAEDSLWSSLSVDEIIENELSNIKNSQKIDVKRLSFLFAPTGSIQDVSIDNGWGNEFLELSKVIDLFT